MKSGKNANLLQSSVILRIVDVIVNDGGSEYNSPPNLSFKVKVDSVTTPIIDNGVIVSVSVQNGGLGYVSGSTKIEVNLQVRMDSAGELSLETGMSTSLKEILRTSVLMMVLYMKVLMTHLWSILTSMLLDHSDLTHMSTHHQVRHNMVLPT